MNVIVIYNLEAMSAVKISAALGLDRISNKPWHICASNAVTGEGLQEGIHKDLIFK